MAKRYKKKTQAKQEPAYTIVDYGIPLTDEQRAWLWDNYPKYFKRRAKIAEYLGVSRTQANFALLQEGIAREG